MNFKKKMEELENNFGCDETLEEVGVNMFLVCPKCGKRRETETIVWPEEREVKTLCSVCRIGIPSRYAHVKEPEFLTDKKLSIFWGGFGTGKTHEAWSQIKSLMLKRDIRAYCFYTEIGLINHLKAGFDSNNFDWRLKSIEKVDFLVIDEVGKSNDSDFNKSQLFEILNTRYNNEKRTILISNAQSKAELAEIIPHAILDRFREQIVEFSGKSRRYS